MSIRFFSRLPLHGETQFHPGDGRNRGDWNRNGPNTGAVSNFNVGDNFTYIDYLSQVAKAIELNGFEGALLVNAPTGEEPWTVCSLLARETKTLKLITAFQPYHLSPWYAVQMAATYQRASNNRLIWNIINGGSEVVQRQVGDRVEHDDRYDRADEFMQVVKGYWNSSEFHFSGKYYHAEGGGLKRGPLQKAELPLICTAGSSEAAREFAAKHADYYLMRAEKPSELSKLIEDVRARARRHGRTDIRFGLSIDVITRPTDAEAFAEAKRFFDNGVAANAVKNAHATAALRTARKLSYETEFNREVEKSYDDFFVHPNVWAGFGYIGIPPGCALVGSYDNVVERIREFNDIGISLFFLAGYPHLEEAYRIGEHILPHFRGAYAEDESEAKVALLEQRANE